MSNDDSPRADPDSEDHELTLLLQRWKEGDHGARDQLIHRVLPDLRRLAAAQLAKERSDHTLQATALVNEAVMRLFKRRQISFDNSGQFVGFSVETMRRILVDYARAHKSKKRGEGQELLPLEEAMGFAPEKSDELIQVDEALDDLARFFPDGAQVVTLRYFGGLTHSEVASAMDISESKARRIWEEARAWLYLQLQPDLPSEA